MEGIGNKVVYTTIPKNLYDNDRKRYHCFAGDLNRIKGAILWISGLFL
ncbi:hypothetical protein [Geobacillus thermodenitrificans]|uniref:Uncharacterized protein n=1 Tax=Geobacillus thermodenitrificans TaxID=33940 RepID=A0ABY9QGZ7_GEOTD|nr:hypothetical protein [Geobacillus thermodenitrificans]WMV78185.1 hypothetical protein HSX42_07660 [Geobacillus thermodenitrificans]